MPDEPEEPIEVELKIRCAICGRRSVEYECPEGCIVRGAHRHFRCAGAHPKVPFVITVSARASDGSHVLVSTSTTGDES